MSATIKFLVLIWLAVVGYWLLPLKKPKQYRVDNPKNVILATDQHCAVRCADVSIKKGVIDIHPDTLKKYPHIKTDVANIIGFSPFKKKKSHLFFQYDFILNGTLAAVDSTPADGYVPVFKVDEWYPTQYIARFWKLEGNWEILYLANLCLGLPVLLILGLRQKSNPSGL